MDASRTVAPGDVITYTNGGDVPVTHRVLEVRDGSYVTKGDANEDADAGVVAPGAVLGRVVFVIPFIGHVILWANTPVGYVALVVTPFVLLAISELHAWARRPDDQPRDAESDLNERAETHGQVESVDAPGRVAMDGKRADVAPIPAVRQLDAATGEPAAVADPRDESRAGQAVAIAVVDLKLTLLAMGSLLAYAGWNVFGEIATGAPSPVSVGVLTGAFLGLLFTGWVTVDAWRAARGAPTPAVAGTAQTDGGATVEDDHE